MKSTSLRFTELGLLMGDLGHESCLPDLLPSANYQNKNRFELDEFDEIYAAYGKLPNAYPYPQIGEYDRSLQPGLVKTAVLENEYLRAVFLPEFGGRLWQLYDKKVQRDLLFTNDCLRFSNLAVRDAWFAGGVEWNCGIIGHSPLTCVPIFVAELEADKDTPVLRMYAFERIRRVTYQMDFWLSSEQAALNARFRIANQTDELQPMYWWSNIAVPEYENGRILVPAQEAYSADGDRVFKVAVPEVNGVDISYYQDIPGQVDYFFNIPQSSEKYVAAVDAGGFGLLQQSTQRLQSRKLFSWGNNAGSARWQSFLSHEAGCYVEIQAGLGKTQYGCLPLAAQTTWEWSEVYSPLQLSAEQMDLPFAELSVQLATQLRAAGEATKVLSIGERFAKKQGKLIYPGNADAQLDNALRKDQGQQGLQTHLDFSSDDSKIKRWLIFLATGELEAPSAGSSPEYFVNGDIWLKKLRECARLPEQRNWYLYYQIGLLWLEKQELKRAKKALKSSLTFERNAWNLHALAVQYYLDAKPEKAVKRILEGFRFTPENLCYIKETLRLMALCQAFDQSVALIADLDETGKNDPRVQYYLAQALSESGRDEEAMAILEKNGGLEVPDIREGDLSIAKLWQKLHLALGKDPQAPIPQIFNFDAFAKESGETPLSL